MSLVIPTKTDGTRWYDLTVELDGKSYTLEFNWNARMESWSASISDADGLIAVSRVLCGITLFDYTDPRLPPGLLTVDVDGAIPPGLTELGDTFKLLYYTEAELLALGA